MSIIVCSQSTFRLTRPVDEDGMETCYRIRFTGLRTPTLMCCSFGLVLLTLPFPQASCIFSCDNAWHWIDGHKSDFGLVRTSTGTWRLYSKVRLDSGMIKVR